MQINGILHHIGLDSLSKWMAWDYPSFIDACNKAGQLLNYLTFTLAAMLVLYMGYNNDLHFEIRNTAEHVRIIRNQWKNDSSVHLKVKAILNNTSSWVKI